MNKKLPGVFANKIEKNISNNEIVYYSSHEEKKDKEEKIKADTNIEHKNIYQKINDIFNSEKYVYKARVEIKLKDGIKKVNIIGYNNGYLITIDNELISITDIEDIKFLS